MLQQIKTLVLSVFGISPDALFVMLSLACYLATCLIARQPLTWVWALAPGFFLSIALELAEIWDHYGAEGLAKAESKEIASILLRHSKDVLMSTLAPLLVFLTAVVLAGTREQ